MYTWLLKLDLSICLRIFQSFGDVTIAGEGLQMLPLSSEGSLTCHTFCDTGQLFIMVISKDPCLSHLLPSVWQRSCHYLFLRLKSVAAGIQNPTFRLRGVRSSLLRQRREDEHLYVHFRMPSDCTVEDSEYLDESLPCHWSCCRLLQTV